jgi:hypothetical protein
VQNKVTRPTNFACFSERWIYSTKGHRAGAI